MRTFQRIARLIRPAIGLPVLSALALIGLLVVVLGCGQSREPAAASAPALAPRISDVPVPATFKFDVNESTDRQTGDLRFVQHLYPSIIRGEHDVQCNSRSWSLAVFRLLFPRLRLATGCRLYHGP